MICVSGLISVSYIFVVYATTFTVPTGACELETTSAQQGLALALPAIGEYLSRSSHNFFGCINIALVSHIPPNKGELEGSLKSLQLLM